MFTVRPRRDQLENKVVAAMQKQGFTFINGHRGNYMSNHHAFGPDIHDRFVAVWLRAPEDEMRQIAEVVFPPGSLPDDSRFTVRELEIMKLLLFQTVEMEDRVLKAQAAAALRRVGVEFTDWPKSR
jgi:hypothetical protein